MFGFIALAAVTAALAGLCIPGITFFMVARGLAEPVSIRLGSHIFECGWRKASLISSDTTFTITSIP